MPPFLRHLYKAPPLTTVRHVQLALLFLLLFSNPCQAGEYNDSMSILQTLLTTTNYNPRIRPLRNQSDALTVFVNFELVSIVEVNDVLQSFTCSGFLGLFWFDEILRWDPEDFGGETMITPKSEDIFKPSLMMLNTLGETYVYDGTSNLNANVFNSGMVWWVPASVFTSSCLLDLTKYPFDVQTCDLKMVLLNFTPEQLKFRSAREEAEFSFFIKNGQWDVVKTSVASPTINITDYRVSSVVISFTLKRKSTFLVVSILLPIVFLSLLNLMVFVIPVDSGEKISYGITVLLALTVFMSIMSGMLPRSSESMPLVITYIFILLTISVLTVVDSVIIVKLHHMEEKEEQFQRARQNFQTVMPKVRAVNQVDSLISHPKDRPKSPSTVLSDVDLRDNARNSTTASTSRLAWSRDEPRTSVNRYRMIGKHIDMISLVFFCVTWLGVTIGFMVAIAT